MVLPDEEFTKGFLGSTNTTIDSYYTLVYFI